MSRIKSLTILVAICLLLGCESLPFQNKSTASGSEVQVVSVSSSQHESQLQLVFWLGLSDRVSKMSKEEAKNKLKESSGPVTKTEIFHSALLSQQLDLLEGWIQARDLFRNLANDQALAAEISELAKVFETHNQTMINWYTKHQTLEQQLVESNLAREILEDKINSLTDLEATISNRKQQVLPASRGVTPTESPRSR